MSFDNPKMVGIEERSANVQTGAVLERPAAAAGLVLVIDKDLSQKVQGVAGPKPRAHDAQPRYYEAGHPQQSPFPRHR